MSNKVKTKTLTRQLFELSRELEFFTEKEITAQIGYSKHLWRTALLKEVIDNALDACETSGIQPEIAIEDQADFFSVEDNGPGLSAEAIEGSLNYLIRISDKAFYVSPTRGQMGNALKAVWAAPYVALGESRAIVESHGARHVINTALDRVLQKPHIDHDVSECPRICGTKITVFWNDIPRCANGDNSATFYKRSIPAAALIPWYALFNPHATFALNGEIHTATNREWKKWRTDDPTSAHWYDQERLRDLIVAYIAQERRGAKPKTIREFISEFKGLAGTRKQKQITSEFTASYLHDLISGGDIDCALVAQLHSLMQRHSLEVKPKYLGEIGEEHFKQWILKEGFFEADSFGYAKRRGIDTSGDKAIPYVIEAAFAQRKDLEYPHSCILTGLNWSPSLGIPTQTIEDTLLEARIDRHDPVITIIHIAKPNLAFLDRGKTRYSSEGESEDITSAIRSIAKEWKKAKRHADKQDRVHQRVYSGRSQRTYIKDVVYANMAEAYNKASANGKLYANARQIYYAIRPLVLPHLDQDELDYSYFNGKLLKDYLEEFTEAYAWKVTWDARGHFEEPHTGKRFGLGGIDVMGYLSECTSMIRNDEFGIDEQIFTCGPINRYGTILFVEKEGFNELLISEGIPKKYDMALMSTKGMPVKAACDLLAQLQRNAKILVLHDFDKSGFEIVKTLRHGTRMARGCDVIDLGFRLEDIEGLESEPVRGKTNYDKAVNSLKECGATQEEIDYLIKRCDGSDKWYGRRVELNAMMSGDLIEWLERKLDGLGIKKTIPENEVLEQAYRRAVLGIRAERYIERMKNKLDNIEAPERLKETIEEYLDDRQYGSWDSALWNIAKETKDT